MRWFRALFAYIRGMFNWKAEELNKNEYVMADTYDQSIKKGEDRLQKVKQAVSKLIAIQETKMQEVKNLSAECADLEKIKQGAGVAAKKLADKLKAEGKSIEDIKNHEDYKKHQSAYERACKNLNTKETRVDELEAELEESKRGVETYKLQLQEMQRQTEKLRDEKQEAIADVLIAKQQDEVNAVLAGIPTDTTDADLAAARRARTSAKASAKLSMELAGNDAKAADAEYQNYAEEAATSNEFAMLIGLDDDKKETKSDLDPARLPEG